MFLNIMNSKIRKELEKNGFVTNDEISLISVIEGVYTFIIYGEKEYIVKYYSKDVSDKVNNYSNISKLSLNFIEYKIISDALVVYENVFDNNEYSCVKLKDIKDENIIMSLAKWYKNLHSCCSDDFRNFYKIFNIFNFVKMMKVLKLENNPALIYVYNNFDNISLKFNRIEKCLVNGRVSGDSVILYNDDGIVGYSADNVCIANKYYDISYVLDSIDPVYRELFISEYGELSESEKLAYYVVENLMVLIGEIHNKTLSNLGKEALNNVNKREFYESVKCLVEWH